MTVLWWCQARPNRGDWNREGSKGSQGLTKPGAVWKRSQGLWSPKAWSSRRRTLLRLRRRWCWGTRRRRRRRRREESVLALGRVFFSLCVSVRERKKKKKRRDCYEHDCEGVGKTLLGVATFLVLSVCVYWSKVQTVTVISTLYTRFKRKWKNKFTFISFLL